MGDGRIYNSSNTWEQSSKYDPNIEDPVSYLFGPRELKGYNYGQQIEQCISQQPSDLTQRKQISFLLCFSLPIISRRLALDGIDAANFYKTIQHIESLIAQVKTDLSETEKKLVYRFYEACFIYQQKNLVNIFKKEEGLTEFLKKLHENYPQGSVLKIQHLSLLLERFSKDFSQNILSSADQQMILSITQESFQENTLLLSKDALKAKEILSESRKDFLEDQDDKKGVKKQSIFKCQENSTLAIQKLLNLFLTNSIALLGEPPCQLGLLLLGSSSRYDRAPYSDLEVALLYEPFEKDFAKQHQVAHYIATLIALLEIQIVFLGESHPEKQGFWLDESTSIRCYDYLRSDIESLIQKGLREKERHNKMPVPKEQNPRNLKLHSFLYDASVYSLVQPLLINTEYGGVTLLRDYQKALKAYLDEIPDGILTKEFFNLLNDTPSKIEIMALPENLTKRKMIALWVWWDILRCLPDHVDLSKGEIDIKKAFHKPVAYFLMGLRLYYELPAKNLEEILIQATERKWLSPYAAQFLVQFLEWEIHLRIKVHIDSGKQNEILSLNSLSPIEQKRVEYVLLIFNLMEKAISYHLKNSGISNFGFELDKILKTYFERGILECNTEKDYQDWFLPVTSYLFYTRALLETHRYYYRQIPDEHRKSCMGAAKQCFNDVKDSAFWRTDEVFWAKLWDAPLSHGERESHQANKAKWDAQLNTLLSPNETLAKTKDIRVYIQGIKSSTQGKYGLQPAITKELCDKKWIDADGKFILKENHSIASRMPGNHLVIPWPLPDEYRVDAILSQENKKNKSDKVINQELLESIQAKAQFYIKAYPEYPLVELFLIELSYQLGYYPPREADVWLWKSEKYDYPLLISEAVAGKTFQEILENNLALQLCPQAFSESIMISGLVSLEDNKPDNLVLLPTESGSRLCLIDADRWFAPSFKGNQLHAKNAIFCLPQMSSEIDLVFREEILSLNPQKLLQTWVAEMEKLGERCSIVFAEKIELHFNRTDLYAFQRNDTRRTLLLPPLPFHAVNELFKHLQDIQSLLSHPTEETGKRITHSQMLSKINTRLANHYSLAREKHRKVLDCFQYAAGHSYLKGSGLQQEYYSSRINFITDRQDMWGKEEELKRAKMGIEENWTRDIEIAKSQLMKLNEKDEVMKAAEDELLKGNFIPFLQLGSNGKDTILGRLDWSKLSLEKQRELLNHLLNPGHWLSISIKNCAAIKDGDLQLLIQKSPLLKKLEIINCQNITYGFWEGVPQYDSSLKTIVLENLQNFQYMGYLATTLYWEKCLELPNLEKLTILNCPNLEAVYIHGPQLKAIHLNNSPKLKLLQTQSESLENLSLTGDTPLLPFNECHKIMNKAYVEKLNVFECETQQKSLVSAMKVFRQFPILLFTDYQDIEEQIIFKFINQIAQYLPTKQICYSEITPRSRKNLQINIRKLFRYFVVFEKNKNDIIAALLNKALWDKNSYVRGRALSALVQLGKASPEVITVLLKTLRDDWSSNFAKAQAAIALMQLGKASPEVVTALTKASGDTYLMEDNRFRRQVSTALVQLGKSTPGAISAIIQALENGSRCAKAQAAITLGNLKHKSIEVSSALFKALKDPSSNLDLKAKAASALVQLGVESPEINTALIKAFESKYYDSFNRGEAAQWHSVRANYGLYCCFSVEPH